MCGMVAGRTLSATKENGPGGLRRAGAAGSAGWPSLNARLSPQSPVSRLHVLRQALPAVPARRRPPGRFSFVGGLGAGHRQAARTRRGAARIRKDRRTPVARARATLQNLAVTRPRPTAELLAALRAGKEALHAAQRELPLREKVRQLLELQKIDFAIRTSRGDE